MLFLESLAVLTDHVVVTGDINIRLDRPSDPLCTQFTNIIESFGFTNHVNQPTHDKGGILDAVITRSDLPAPTIDVIDTGLSDHRLIKWSTDLRRPPPIYVTETRRSWKHFQVDEFRSALQKSPLCDMDFIKSLDADQLASVYDNVIASILDRLVPLRKVTIRKRPSDPWFDDVCRDQKKRARRLERRVHSAKTDVARSLRRAEWLEGLRQYRHTLNTRRSEFWLQTIKIQRSAPRKLWQTIDKVLGRGRTPADNLISADEFHHFFDKKVADVRESTADAADPTYSTTSHRLSSFSPVSVGDILGLIQCTPNKQSTADPLPTWLLKECAATIAPFITQLVNCSIATGRVPTVFKVATITPLPKKPGLDTADVKSYRPISNLSVLSKMLERVVSRQLVNYLNINQLFPDRQSAYRAFHSTETVLADILSDILLAIDSGNFSLLSLLDLSAAFDTVDHDILLQRLHLSFGMSSTALEWMTSYLTGRQQCVRHAGSSSTATILTCGVPQGSVLGPILFLLYTADILSIISKHGLHGHLYADDSQVYGFCRPDSTDVQHLRSVSVSCISDIADWMKCNRLQLNSSKSEFIWCSSSRRVEKLDRSPFVIGADAVEPKNEVRDLGLFLDRDLSMTSHITGLVRTSFGILSVAK